MLFFITLILAIITTGVTKALTGRWLTPVLLYWVGFLLAIPAAYLSALVELTPPITPYGEDVLLKVHYGMAIGSVLASVFGYNLRRKYPRPAPQFSKTIWVIVGAQALLGVALLASRVATVGLDISAIRADYLDASYLTDSLPASVRLYNYVSLAALVPSMLIAFRDRAMGRISWLSLMMLFLAAAPGGISTGGRIWLVQMFAAYFLAYLIAPGPPINVWWAFTRGAQFLLAVVALVGVFTLFGSARDSANLTVRPPPEASNWTANQLIAYAPLYGYLGVPTVAAGPYSAFQHGTNGNRLLRGAATFPFIADQLVRLRLLPENRSLSYTAAVRRHVARTVDLRIGTTHATLAPLLVADFGYRNLILSAALCFFFIQGLFLLFFRLGGIWYVAATCSALYGGLLIFQDASFGTASAFIPVIAALLLSRVLRVRWMWERRELMAPR